MIRTDIINYLITQNGYKSYLEIGLNNPEKNYIHVKCESKESVDPFFCDTVDEFGSMTTEQQNNIIQNYLTYRMTSDEFFEKASPDLKYDIIFIDGLHIEDQVGRDIVNSLRHLNEGGVLVIHDCLPCTESCQTEERNEIYWNGTTWKAVCEIARQGVEFDTVDTDTGCCVIKRPKDVSGLVYPKPCEVSYMSMAHDPWYYMHYITPIDFIVKYSKGKSFSDFSWIPLTRELSPSILEQFETEEDENNSNNLEQEDNGTEN